MSNSDPFDPTPDSQEGDRPTHGLPPDPPPDASLFSTPGKEDPISERLPEAIQRMLPEARTRLETCAGTTVVLDLTEKIGLLPRRRGGSRHYAANTSRRVSIRTP